MSQGEEMITETSTVVRAENLLATDLDDETILMSIQQGAYYGMEQTARRIWQIIATPHTVAELCRQLAGEYAVDPAVCRQDVLAFLQELHAEGLIVVA
jgi:hypothetical protein